MTSAGSPTFGRSLLAFQLPPVVRLPVPSISATEVGFDYQTRVGKPNRQRSGLGPSRSQRLPAISMNTTTCP